MTIMAIIFQRLLAASKWLVEELNGYQWHAKHPAIPRQINTLKPLLLLLPSALEFEGFSEWVCLKSEYISFQYPVSKDSDTPISVSRIGRTFFTWGRGWSGGHCTRLLPAINIETKIGPWDAMG
jgi:hypothetical protein